MDTIKMPWFDLGSAIKRANEQFYPHAAAQENNGPDTKECGSGRPPRNVPDGTEEPVVAAPNTCPHGWNWRSYGTCPYCEDNNQWAKKAAAQVSTPHPDNLVYPASRPEPASAAHAHNRAFEGLVAIMLEFIETHGIDDVEAAVSAAFQKSEQKQAERDDFMAVGR